MRRQIRKRRQESEPLEVRTLLSTITVTSLEDNTDTDGEVTLREALIAANEDRSVDGSEAGNLADTIKFASGLEGGTVHLSIGELTVTEDSALDLFTPDDGEKLFEST